MRSPSSSRWRAAGFVAAVLLLAAWPAHLGPGAQALELGDDPPGREVCRIDDRRVPESSGLAPSAARPDVLWTTNDSGDSARLFALDADCAVVGTLTVRGVQPRDVEDLAFGPDRTLWLADIGDNATARDEITLISVPEPESVVGGSTAAGTRHRVAYPDGPHDAEALLVHPRTGQVVIVTKRYDGPGRVYFSDDRLADGAGVQRLRAGEPVRLTERSGLLQAVTGGAVSSDGRLVALRTYEAAYVFPVPGDDLVAALRGPAVPVTLPAQRQGEAIAFRPNGRALVVSSEGRGTPLVEVDLAEAAPDLLPGPPDAEQGSGEEDSTAAAGLLLVGAAAVALLALGGLAWLRRRRRRFVAPAGRGAAGGARTASAWDPGPPAAPEATHSVRDGDAVGTRSVGDGRHPREDPRGSSGATGGP